MLRPVSAKWPVSQPFGVVSPIYTALGYAGHHGLDIACPIGTLVRAAESGLVRYARSDPTAGNFIHLINHPGGLQTRYLHMSVLWVTESEMVERGQPLGLSGDTGQATGPHSHWEVIDPAHYDNGYKGRVDPALYVEEAGSLVRIAQALHTVWWVKERLESGKPLPRKQKYDLAKALFDAGVVIKVELGLE